ncbi:Fc receptor-like protein 5 isoform X2 [Scomber japonicus]|uniref:Fc receptor-like protein 5 isoform X2 n=1 Tax=Scomber japonicus TaxID=13676 RepID=UPI0023069D26|nr:Fc receptor-like protein 5 isoform X2 [Scomber japonicus]
MAKIGEDTGISNSIKFSVVTPPSNTRVTSVPSPAVVFEGSRIVLSCDTKGSHLSYTWFFNMKEITSSTSSLLNATGNKLVMERVTPGHAGYYYCMAWSILYNTKRFSTSRPEVKVEVKVYVSTPRISFSIFKEGDRYRGNVTCWSLRGTPPVNFSLSLDDREEGSVVAAESLAAWFLIPMELSLDMGVARCRVKNEVQELLSEPLTLEVVPVGGEVKVEVEHLYRSDFELAGVRLNCQVSRGTFPYVSWLLNDSALLPETHEDTHIQPVLPHYTLVDHRRTLILTELDPEVFGYYRCRARDSFDDSGAWVESAAVPLRRTEVLMVTIEVIAIIFCGFLVLTLAVAVACVYRKFDCKQAHAHSATTNPSPDTLPMSQSGGSQADTSSVELCSSSA